MSSQANISLEQRLRHEGWCLHERLESIKSKGLRVVHNSSELHALQAWRQVVAPGNQANFGKRLGWDGLTPAEAARALAPDPDDYPQDPSWWPILRSLRQAATKQETVPGLEERCKNQPFVHVWRPTASWGLQTLQQRCSKYKSTHSLSDNVWLDLAESLLERLCKTADQALWEQFNQCRTPGQMLLAHLGANGDGCGEPVHKAYDSFVADQLSSGIGLLLTEYPVLGRLLAVITEHWLDGSEEMLSRLESCRLPLQEQFGISHTAALRKVEMGLSDPHRRGRAVAILSFDDPRGNAFGKVVYKPKDMRVDETYQQLLTALNAASSETPLRCLKVLSCDGYGFMEWVEHRPCSSDEELARFYTNAGRTMAVLHILGCTDCHYENLIASGDQLVLIDTETLLEADLHDLISDDGDNPELLSDLQTSMKGSVLRSGLLPQWLMAGAGKKRAFDISALGIQPPPVEREMPSWLGLNSDGMMAGRTSQPCRLPTSLPVALGSPQRLTDFLDQLCDGFGRQLQEIIRLRLLLLHKLESFRGQPRRLVARATRIYFTIQRQMLEPASLRNAVAHGLKLEQLSRSFVLASEKPLNWPMFAAEIRQMELLDIPFFEHLIDGNDLPLPGGLDAIPGFMKASGLDAARKRLQALNQIEIQFQQQLIRGAIAARHLKPAVSSEQVSEQGQSLSSQASGTGSVSDVPRSDVYRKEAFHLGEELWNSAIRNCKGRPEWLGMDLAADGESFHFGLIGNSLYSGASGIALLFARLALASHEPSIAEQWRQRAWSCFGGLAELAEQNRNDRLLRLMRDLPYGLIGSGGILLALSLIAQAGIDAAASLAALLIQQVRPERLMADEVLDVIGGGTGLVGSLLNQNEPHALELAAACGERLLNVQLDCGGWLSSSPGHTRRPALTGFSHGTAGMAAALARLAQATGDNRFADGARRAIAYERGVFVEDKANWPDFRNSLEPSKFMTSWCHGAPGILLSRQVLVSTGLADGHTASEQQAARSTTLAALKRLSALANLEPAAHLCCGVLGLTALLRIEAKASTSELDPQVPQSEMLVMKQAMRNGSYNLFSVENGSLNLPGLFTGKAGVALALIEAADGLLWLPSVLSAGLLEI